MAIRPEGYVPALGEAQATGAACIWIHTHPGTDGIPLASDHDRIVDRQIGDLFRLRSESPYYGALIFSPQSSSLRFCGYLQHEGKQPVSVDRLWQVGDRWQLLGSYDSRLSELPPLFDRNVRAFGPDIQATLHDLRVAVIGCGGTGSCVAEQLVRLGVRRLVLMDPDRLATSNLTRVYGSYFDDVGAPKTNILERHLRSIAPDLQCDVVDSMVTLVSAARQLIGCDLIFGCTDDNAGRLVLSRFSSYLMTPVIDCGVLLSADSQGRLLSIDGRVTVLSPGAACLVCRGRIDLERAGAELLTPAERARRQDEGYAPALGPTEPAVVAFTTAVAAAAVGELLERLVGYGPDPRPSEILLRWHEREISTNVAAPRTGHYCDPAAGKIGIGVTAPFLVQTWPT
jgi:hypothetical protein